MPPVRDRAPPSARWSPSPTSWGRAPSPRASRPSRRLSTCATSACTWARAGCSAVPSCRRPARRAPSSPTWCRTGADGSAARCNRRRYPHRTRHNRARRPALAAKEGILLVRHLLRMTPGLGGGIVGGAAVHDGRVYALINESGDAATHGPYAVALDEHSGRLLWTSKPLSTGSGYYTNATPQVIGDTVFAGFSPPEGDSTGQGGFVLLDA